MQPWHGAPPHQSAADSSHCWGQYSGTPWAATWRHAQPFVSYEPPFTDSSWHTAAPCVQFAQPWTTPMQFQGYSGCRPTAEPGQKRELNEAYCLVDKEGKPKPFSSVSQLSSRSYEDMLSKIFGSGGAQKLLAVLPQEKEERERLEKIRNAVAEFLQKNVSDHAGNAMTAKGVAEEQAEVDTVFNGGFNHFAESIERLSTVMVSGMCEKVQRVLVEICSDSRFVAMKLYQIEIQSCLVARRGFLVDEANEAFERPQLYPETTGFAIIFNRAALQINTEVLAREFGLTNVQSLLVDKKLHIAYFQSEAAVPAALSMATEARKKVMELEKKLQGSTAALTKAVWVRQLQKKDDSGGFELVGNPFPIDPVPQNIAYLKKAIKKEEELAIAPSKIEIFSREDGKWKKEEKMSESLRDNDEDTPYGYIVP